MAIDNKGILLVTYSRNCNLGGALQEFALYACLRERYTVDSLSEVEKTANSCCNIRYLDYKTEMYDTLSRPIRGGVLRKIRLMFAAAIKSLFRWKNNENKASHKQQHYSLILVNPRLQFMQLLDRLYLTISDILHYRQRKKAINSFHDFHDKYLQYTDNYTAGQLADSNTTKRLFSEYSICLVGSDQVWNASWIGASPIFFLGFVPDGIRKVSYASSFGNYKFGNETMNNQIAAYLSDFHSISVRESYSVTHLKEKCNINSQCVLDPTLLLTKEQWCNELSIQRNEKPPYLLVYVLGDRRTLIPFAKRVAKHLGLEVKIIDTKFLLSFTRSGVEYFPSTGPREFISLYSQAAFVVTNSFHGTAFSVNFNIPFFTVSSLVNERARSLLEIVGLSDRLISNCRSCDLKLTEMDFTDANRLLAQERKRSIDYLKKAIGAEHEVGDES